ncbi:hypothetical protein T4C_10985 [Trichinella pseudospiralis]|uniref:Uncharacterized protein n=1 Tax=Trichinella pseudospiralis TaxID=6337 RepID=A0A0V1GCJ8_TRIPS|nr:hypothetical protein T4C_10985 [Trichinella pseudospiralis]
MKLTMLVPDFLNTVLCPRVGYDVRVTFNTVSDKTGTNDHG